MNDTINTNFQVSSKTPNFSSTLNSAEISLEKMEELKLVQNDRVTIININNGIATNCLIKVNHNITDHNEVRLSAAVKRKLACDPACSIILEKFKEISEVHKVNVQNIDRITENVVTVSRYIYEQITASPCEKFELFNRVTRASLDISKKDIIVNENLSDTTIQLNYLHRQILDLEIPITIEKEYLNAFIEHTHLEEEEREHLKKTYSNDAAVEDTSFENKKRLKSILSKVGYYSLQLYSVKPELDLFYEKTRRNWIRKPIRKLRGKLFKYLIGYNKAHLKAIRPYASDEVSNVVRITTTMQKILGVENTDNIVIKYRDKRVVARILEVDSDSIVNMRITNAISCQSDLEYSIGIPAHIRKALGMKDLNCVCTIHRDTSYIFKKYAHLQIIPTIAIFFTVSQVISSLYLQISIALALLLISLFVNFSSERNKISN